MATKWTKSEEGYMERRYLLQPVEVTAQKLNRTVPSVKHKAVKMGLNHYTESLNAKVVANCFNVDMRVIKRWINEYNLPCKKVVCSNQTRFRIEAEDFWKWAEQHKDIINWSKYEQGSLIPEPDWLEDAINNCKSPKLRKRYTQEEIVMVKNLLHRGLNYKEIAKQMGRSYYGISHLCREIYCR